MKFISWIFKFLAIVLLFAFIITLPFSILFRNTGEVLFDQNTMFSLVNSNFLAPEFVASFGKQAVEGRIISDEPYGNAVEELLIAGLSNLSEQEWLELSELVAPSDVVSTSLDQILTGFYTWLDSPDPKPSYLVDLKPWKATISQNSLPSFEIVLNGLPQCSAMQLDTYASLGDITNETKQVPNCRPPEPYYSMLLDVAATEVPLMVGEWPNIVDISEEFSGEQDFDQTKIVLRQARDNAGIAWIPLMVLFILAIPMGARSIDGLFKWVGWPLLLAGLFTLIIGLILTFFTEGMVLQLGLEEMTTPMQTTITAVIAQISMPTFRQGVGLLVIGIIALVIGAVLGAIISGADKASAHVAAEISTAQYGVVMPQMPTVPAKQLEATRPYQQPPKDALDSTEENANDEESELDDDSRPTGMFG